MAPAFFTERFNTRPQHWQDMDSAISRHLLVGDILYGDLNDLYEDRRSHRRIVVARPSEERLFLLSTSMAPSDDAPSKVEETFITSGTELESKEVGSSWHRKGDCRIAMKAAEDAVDGTISHVWLRVWSEDSVHLVARVARAGLHDSMQTISVTHPEGSFFSRTSSAKVRAFRPLPKLFAASGMVTVYGGTAADKQSKDVLPIS